MTIAFLIVVTLALILAYKFVFNHAKAESAKIKQLGRIVDHLDLIKRSIDYASGEVVGPVLADIRTDIHRIARKAC